MRRYVLIACGSAIVLHCLNSQFARGQSAPQKFEVGAQFTLLRQNRPDSLLFSNADPTNWDPGLGGRFTFNITRILSLEAELNYFPRQRDSLRLGHKTQGLFGIKAGRRGEKFGIFGKVRPGFMRFTQVFDCPGTDVLSCDEFAKTDFAIDLGGVVEYYPSHRTVLRFDVGDTIIRFRDTTVFPFSPEFPSLAVRQKGRTVNNFQLGVGVGFRF